MAISYYAEDVKLPALRKRETNEWIRTIASLYDKKCGDIAYIFCSDEKYSTSTKNICNTTTIPTSSHSITPKPTV